MLLQPSASHLSLGASAISDKSLLSWARPILVSFVLHGFRKDVVVHYFFVLWRLSTNEKKDWGGVATDLHAVDKEAVMPPQSESKEKAPAAVFCVEELGVIPPPDTGWVPRGGNDGDDNSVVAGWWANMENNEWIYHEADQMYFHLPSNTLWERRYQECCDPGDVPHTYMRADAFHLKALSHFAMSLTTALVPMAWKAWVRYVKRKRDKGGPSTSKVKQSQQTQQKAHVVVDDRSQEAKGSAREITAATTATGDHASTELSGAATTDMAQECTELELASLEPSVLSKKVANQNADAVAAAKAAAAAAAVAAVAAAKAAATAAEAAEVIAANSSDKELDHKKPAATRKRRCCFACFGRGRRTNKAPKDEYREALKGVSQRLDTSAAVDTEDAVNWTAWCEQEQRTPPLPADVKRPSFDTSERHTRRLDQFLADVKKNPQRLVQHVEKRRAGSLHLAYFVA